MEPTGRGEDCHMGEAACLPGKGITSLSEFKPFLIWKSPPPPSPNPESALVLIHTSCVQVNKLNVKFMRVGLEYIQRKLFGYSFF